MLILHFLGLAMGLGTSFAFTFLGMASSKMEKSEGQKFTLNSMSLATMGHIGLTLLLISGGYLMTPYWKILGDQPLLIAKLALYVVLLVVISIISVAARKAKQGETEKYLKKIRMWGQVSFLTGMAIVVLAVLVFR